MEVGDGMIQLDILATSNTCICVGNLASKNKALSDQIYFHFLSSQNNLTGLYSNAFGIYLYPAYFSLNILTAILLYHSICSY